MKSDMHAKFGYDFLKEYYKLCNFLATNYYPNIYVTKV